MSDTGTYWFSPAPSEVTSSRISLDFDLRAADLFFRDLIVPEVGRIWFARQISWPLAALVLHKELASRSSNAPKPTAICHGIEALACKLEYLVDSPTQSTRILGSRAFGRDSQGEVGSFHRLRQASNYVRNTHRQAATRALRDDGGLGFTSGARFDLFELEPVGHALADAFLGQRVGKGGTSLRKSLLEWLKGDRQLSRSKTLLQALSPEYPTDEERDLVRKRLLETERDAGKKRQRLARALGRAAALPDIEDTLVVRLREAGHQQQANEVLTARAFGAVLDRTRDAVASLTRAVEPGRGGAKVATLVRDAPLRNSIKDLRTATRKYVGRANGADVKEATSRVFADAIIAADDADAIRILTRRAGEVLGLADGSVVRGPLFRVVGGTDESSDLEDGAESIEPDRTGRTFRLANLHAILRDVEPRGSR